MIHTCSVTLPDGRVTHVDSNTLLGELLSPWSSGDDPLVAARANNELLDLALPVQIDCRLEPIYLSSPEGLRCYRQSLCFLLSLATSQVDETLQLIIGHSLGHGYFYSFGGADATDDLLEKIERRMLSLVDEDLAIELRRLSYEQAVAYFSSHHMDETAALFEHRNESRYTAHVCGDFIDISHGPLVPRLGVLRAFAITRLDTGFVLRYPPAETPHAVAEYRHSPLLYSIYQEYKEWGRILGVTSVGTLNRTVHDGSISEFVRVNETLHEKKIADIARQIDDRAGGTRIVLVAGPSSSGKTTFTKRLSLQLSAQGMQPVMLSVDDYFVNREKTPLDSDGRYDFEHIEAIDIDLFNDHLLRLSHGEEVELPEFDFRTGQRQYNGRRIQLPPGGILIAEGIHCLNERLTERVPADEKFKIYISALTQLNLDDRNRISTTDNRFIRRLVRDSKFRGHTALDTLGMWPSVQRGERRNIFPFQDSADAAFNSALDYELGVLKSHAEPLLRRIHPESPFYGESLRMLAFLSNFTSIPEKFVPQYSILREFVGDSGFHY